MATQEFQEEIANERAEREQLKSEQERQLADLENEHLVIRDELEGEIVASRSSAVLLCLFLCLFAGTSLFPLASIAMQPYFFSRPRCPSFSIRSYP